MSILYFIGLGLHDEKGMSLRGLEEARAADLVFLELYTSRLPGLSLEALERLIGKKIKVLNRSELEENCVEIIKAMAGRRCALLVPGDPLVSTTHTAFRLEAEKRGIRTSVVHAASIVSAIAGATGLQSSKFGRTVSMPIPRNGRPPDSPYNRILENVTRGLHTLLLPEIDISANRYITIPECIQVLEELEASQGKGIIKAGTLVVAVARIGSDDFMVKADSLDRLREMNFGDPPYSLVFPSKLHFVEVEALRVFAQAPADVLERYK